ncbi:Sas10/U3 ribonucleoprotein (Utp) family protein [Actinidia rufa]|uniref:Sas10/U3 ribonucleoprotein (Utp) family protein n=1 Tax=Actinidia rufa TaxID=165716 RepID=A0A7J0E8R0_9ERIC|nr:Sas10/U3 ribonucleoprotein (Utp) family protein [Actinidia rufa]
MGKGRKGRNSNNKNPKKRASHHEDAAANDMMDDEIDAFHKQRDIVPLDINDDMEGSDEDDEHPVFDFKDANDEQDSDDEDEDIEDDAQLTGLAAKIARQQKYLRAKVGGVEDEMHNDIEDEEEKRTVWGRRKDLYHGGDNFDYELQSSDEELPAEEEAEVLRLQKEKAKSLSMEDFGLEDVSQDESDGEPTLEEILGKGKAAPKSSADKEAHDEPAYEEVKKDLNALSKEEQMDVVYSSAPELVGLLSELNDALEELENKVNPLLRKVKEGGNTMKAGMHYMEVKQLLLMTYCQAITFYLLLKSEGQPVRDHPVIARLVEIKNLLDKVKELDVNLPSDLENILGKKIQTETVRKSLGVDVTMASDSLINIDMHAVGKQEATVVPREAVRVLKVDSSKNDESKGRKRKHLNDQVGMQSMEMLKVRSALEEKLKQKGIFGSIASKHDRVQKTQLETLDDFDDEATDLGKVTPGTSKGHATSLSSSKLSQRVTPQLNKPKAVSGDDDLPMRDDIGERRRRHELRVLAGAGIKSVDDVDDGPGSLESDEEDDMEDGVQSESADELYEQAKQQRAAKLAAKAEMYSRTSAVQSNPEETLVDGKRHITYQMEKNRGLTRARKKLIKNPRKKYKLKHQKAVVRRKGQVRDIKKPTGPYGGEASGINAGISRSIRFKS